VGDSTPLFINEKSEFNIMPFTYAFETHITPFIENFTGIALL
jgi:hypothetical protein